MLAQDESRFCSESSRITSWSTKGIPVSYIGYKHPISLSCFGSLNLSNGQLICSFHDRGNSQTTIEHLQVVRDNYNKNIPLVFLMDNAPWHKTQKVIDFCNDNNISLLFFPPYSPEFNPIERVWSFIKGKIKKNFFSSAILFKEFVLNLLHNINFNYKKELSALCCSLI